MGWSVRRVANQSIDPNVDTAISWDTEDQDTPGNFSPPASVLTIPAGGDGLWAVTFNAIAAAVMNSMGYCRIKVNIGGPNGFSITNTDFDDVTNPVTGSWCLALPNLPLVATNTITGFIQHRGGAATNFTGRLFAYRVGA